MANKIDIKHSNIAGVVPTTSSINLAEIAFNTADGKAYFKQNGGTASIKEFIATPHSGSFILSGSQTIAGYMQFMPVNTNIDTSISASYIYVSGSTNDLYFSQNGNGYANTTRLRWLEGNLYTGLLNGGIISSSIGSTTFQVQSGSGIIVNLNASLGANPYPTVQYVNWPTLTASIASLSASYDQQFVAINSSGQIFTQGIPYNDGDYNTKIPIGIVIHQNRSTINAVQTFPSVAYGYKQRTYDFIKAFGPLKISGYTLQTSSSYGLLLDGGTAWVDGRNYIVDPSNPSYITEAVGIATSKIYYYYQSGSEFVYNTNNGAGYSSITSSFYSNNGVLTTVNNNKWTIQRVFYFPNSATKAFYIYYGNAEYADKATAIAAIQTETFSEAPNTAANAIFVGYMILEKGAVFTNINTYEFRAGSLFRAGGSGGSSGGGGGGATSLAGLTDVSISSPTNGQPLVYNTSATKWNNSSALTASLYGTASYANTVKPAGPTSSIQFNKNGIITGSTELTFQNNTLRIDNSEYSGNPYIVVNDNSFQTIISSNDIYTQALRIKDSYLYAEDSPNTIVYLPAGLSYKYLAASVNSITASLYGDITLSTIPTASFITASNVWGPFGTSSVASASYASGSTSASYASSSTSASYAATASYANNLTVAGTLTAQTIVVQTITSSTDYVTGSTRFGSLLTNTHQFTGSVSITGSLNVAGTGITGSLFGTASWANNATSASYASGSTSASYALSSSYAAFATSASYASGSTSASYALSSSYSLFATSASYASGSTSASYALSASYSQFATSASYASGSTSASYALSSSYSLFATSASYASGSTSASYALSSSYSLFATSASYSSGSTSASYASGSTSASYASSSTSASYAATASYANNLTVAGTLTAQTIVVQTITSSISFMTGSTKFGVTSLNTHQFTGSVSITGSLNVTGAGVTGSLFGTSSWANNAVTASYVSGNIHTSTNPAFSASYASGSTSASYAVTASYAANSAINFGAWTVYTPFISASTTNPTPASPSFKTGSYSFIENASGGTLYVKFSFGQTAAGNAGSGIYKFTLPTGYTIDTTNVTTATAGPTTGSLYHACTPLGSAHLVAPTNQVGVGTVLAYDNSSLCIIASVNGSTSNTLVSSSFFHLGQAASIRFTAEVPYVIN